jgi:hypothetical protein
MLTLGLHKLIELLQEYYENEEYDKVIFYEEKIK